MSNVPHSVDNALVSDMQRMNNQQAPVQAVPEVKAPDVPHRTSEEHPAETPSIPQAAPEPTQEPTKSIETGSESVPNTAEDKPAEAEVKADSTIDEYGNPIAPPKTYTEDEVQEMIRRRFSRGKFADQPTQQQVQKAADEFKADPNSEETWETQLEAFVERTIEKRQTKFNEQQWRAQEAQKQADFEVKFNSGMGKYSDFNSVVQPIVSQGFVPDTVMLAIRNLDNPAAFLYGASKMHAKDLERIARLNDAPSQALEIGRLHERMVKSSKIASNAPRPLDAPKGDMPPKMSHQPSLDARISDHARQKDNRRAGRAG